MTNVAIQKTSPDYDPEKGCKWSAQQLRKYLVARHGTAAVSFCSLSLIIFIVIIYCYCSQGSLTSLDMLYKDSPLCCRIHYSRVQARSMNTAPPVKTKLLLVCLLSKQCVCLMAVTGRYVLKVASTEEELKQRAPSWYILAKLFHIVKNKL